MERFLELCSSNQAIVTKDEEPSHGYRPTGENADETSVVRDAAHQGGVEGRDRCEDGAEVSRCREASPPRPRPASLADARGSVRRRLGGAPHAPASQPRAAGQDAVRLSPAAVSRAV